jgi:hypothetical protein
MVHSGPRQRKREREMTTLEIVKSGASRQAVSPDVAATAEVLRALYLPSECRHLVEMLRDETAAPAGGQEPIRPLCGGQPDSPQPEGDAAFLDTVEALFANDGPREAPGRGARDLRDTFQIRVRFLDALQDEMRRARAGGFPPRLPGREELARLLERERARYGPEAEPVPAASLAPAIREQLRAA